MDLNSESLRPINCHFRSLKGKASIVNPVNKLYSLAYEVQHACCFRVIIVMET